MCKFIEKFETGCRINLYKLFFSTTLFYLNKQLFLIELEIPTFYISLSATELPLKVVARNF